MHALRFPFAAGSGFLLTLGVFSVLWGLVSRPIDVQTAFETRAIDFTRQIVERPVETKRVEKVEHTAPTLVPKAPGLVGPDASVDPVRYARTKLDVTLERGKGLPVGQDRDVVPIVRVPPQYPARAATEEVEGWVRVQFTIAATGSVKDAVVVDSAPAGTRAARDFEAAALAAIARWRYNPKVENGVPVERVGLQTVIRFELARN